VYKVLHVSDLHYDSEEKTMGKIDAKVDINIRSSQEEEFFDNLNKYLSKTNDKVDLFVISGDIINGGDRNAQKMFSKKFMETIKKLGYDEKNIMIVPGNHDIKKGSAISSSDRYNEFLDSWKGCKLPYLDGVYKNVDIVCDTKESIMFIPLNTSNWSQVKINVSKKIQSHLEALEDQNLKKEFERQFTYDAAYVSSEQINEIEKKIVDIKNHELYTKVLVQHHHLVNVDDAIEVKEMGDILNSNDLKEFIKKFNIKILLHGHKHVGKTFYEYLNKNNKPYKLLISSAPNLNKNSFFQILNLKKSNISISEFDRTGNLSGDNIFRINDTTETDNTIVLEDDNITELYNKVISISNDKENQNKQLICNLDLKKNDNEQFPIPEMYPEDKKQQEHYEKEIKKHVEWWQQDSTIFDDIGELHGPRLKRYNGYIDQLNYISKQLNSDINTSKTIAILIEPIKDFHDDIKYPSFISCQFIVRDKNNKKYLDIVANFRKQEMRYWWALNIAELFKLLLDMKNKIDSSISLGKIVTISNKFTFAEEKAFGRSYVSSIDYYIDMDPAYLMHQAHSIMCNNNFHVSSDKLEDTPFIKLLDEIFHDFHEFAESKNNKDGNAKPRIGIVKFAEFVKKAKNNECSIQNNFHESLERLGEIAENSDFINKFEQSLKSFKKELDKTMQHYHTLKKSLVDNTYE
jgi:3',5'-cyclic AMP phosphodiesterase CpdA